MNDTRYTTVEPRSGFILSDAQKKLARAALQLPSASPNVAQGPSPSLRGVEGQTMILLVTLMGGMLMLATAISGLLMYYQVQQSGDAGRSTIAIYAADAGVERAARYFYYEYAEDPEDPGRCWAPNPCTKDTAGFEALGADATLPNGATFSPELLVPPGGEPNAVTLLSAVGMDASGRTVRSLQTIFISNPAP